MSLDRGDDRAQAHTLEGVAAAILIVTSVVLALQMTAVTPLSASTSNQHVETQERAAAHGVLATLDDGGLRNAVLSSNRSGTGLRGPERTHPNGYYVGSGNESVALFDRLNETFGGRGIAYNVRFVSLEPGDGRSYRKFVYQGDPTENAVTVSRTVTIYDDDHLVGPDGPTSTRVGSARFVDASNSTVYNVVAVEVTVWRM